MSTPLGSSQWMYSSGEEEVTQQSLKFNDDESQYLSWTPAAAGNRKTWTWSGWVKRGNLTASSHYIFGANANFLRFEANALDLYYFSGGIVFQLTTSQLFRDVSAWYHIIVKYDTTQATASDRIKFYVNGTQVTSFSTASYPSQNSEYNINNNTSHYIGFTSATFDGYLSDVYFIDGQALDASSFGQFTNGYWEKKDYSGSYGTNGFHLTFADDVVSEGFNTVTYRGTGTTQSISGLGFEPDFVWTKERNAAEPHRLYDSIRGTTKDLESNSTSAESIRANTLTSFDSDGFTLGTSYPNNSGDTYVAWAWDAGANNAPTGHSSVTYTGTGSTQSIKGLGFEPDLVWIKDRNYTGLGNIIFDSVRGAGKFLFSSDTSAEGSGSGILDSFDADGFTIGSNGHVNNSGDGFVAWGWDAGSGSPVSNTDGSITSTVKASQANGFSIASYTGNGTAGATVGHGLSSAPEMIITKNRNNGSEYWSVYHKDVGNTAALFLNSTSAAYTSSAYWNNTSPTSSVFSIGSNPIINESGSGIIAYCFNSVAGYSSIGSYTGNGSSSGPTITTGFRSGFVMIKRADSTGNWYMWDTSRHPFNPNDNVLYADLSNAESVGSSYKIDVTATGFQIKHSGTDINASGGTYIYMAFKGSYSDYVSNVNNDGTIESRVKANPSYGFSIASYVGNGTSGATIGHSLGAAPDVILVKDRSQSVDWHVYHSANTPQPETEYLILNQSLATIDAVAPWNDTAPTSSVFTVGNGVAVNTNGNNYIAYCFSEVAGYSSFGSYSGTGSTVSVNTGFKAAWLLIKRTDTNGFSWVMLDNTRNPSGELDDFLLAENSIAETNNGTVKVLPTATGFDVTGTATSINASGGTYIYMAFADTREAAFWKDVSGQGNHWTPNNLDYRDSLIDSPANNFAVLNAVDTSTYCALSEGNTKIASTSASYWGTTRSTFAVDSGKWYWETCVTADQYARIGILGLSATLSGQTSPALGLQSDGYAYYGPNGYIYNNNSGSAYGATYTAGDVIGVALDLDGGTLTFYKNGTSQGTAATGLSGSFAASISVNTGSVATTVVTNFGQDSTFSGLRPAGGNQDDNGIGDFAYAPPAGYLALCTANLPTPTIIDGSEHFNTVLYSGNGSTQSITGVGFQPDFVWGKLRSTTSFHRLHDVVRGSDNTLASNDTGAEISGNGIVSFDSDGWTMDSGTNINQTFSYAAWAWKAGGTAVSNTDGSITSQVSANTNAGFSIVSYTGTGSNATVGHGLGVTPDLVIVKNRDFADNWRVWSVGLSSGTHYTNLNSTSAQASNSSFFTGLPTSSVFQIGTDTSVNRGGDELIAYCFANVEGFSKAGSYTGNGSTDGPFVYTGFRPAWVMIKRTDVAADWIIWDTVRDTYNEFTKFLYPNDSYAEAVGSNVADGLSNGFKLRGTTANRNASGGTYIYLAFAENPFKYANAR